MGFEIINKIKKEKGLTNAQIAQMSGVTLSTLDKITSGVNKNPKLDTLQALCSVLGCTLNDFVDAPGAVKKPLSANEEKHIKKYRALDEHGREMVDSALSIEYKRCVEQARPAPTPAPDTAAKLEDMERRLNALEQDEISEEITPDPDAGSSASTDTEKLA